MPNCISALLKRSPAKKSDQKGAAPAPSLNENPKKTPEQTPKAWSYGDPQGAVTRSTALTSHPPTSPFQAQKTSAGEEQGQASSSTNVEPKATTTQPHPRVPNFSRPFQSSSQTGAQSSSTNPTPGNTVNPRRVPEYRDQRRDGVYVGK